MQISTFSLVSLIALSPLLYSAEYFVSPNGNDHENGQSEKTAFQTIRQGMKVLQAGDTLTILPGKYHEAIDATFNGDSGKKTVIRAKYPGTVLIHGDLPLTDFHAVGDNGIYVTRCESKPEAVMEQDTLMLYNEAQSDFAASSLPALASWYFDTAEKLLYLRTSDGEPPQNHILHKSVSGAHGFSISAEKGQKVANVEIDGLIVRGFWKNDLAWGIVIYSAEKCQIRRCIAVSNCGGIAMYDASRSLIDECIALANGSPKQASCGNIIVLSGSDSMIDRSLSYGSRTYGIRFYGQNQKDIIRRSISIGDKRGAIWIKPSDNGSKLEEVYTPDNVACNYTEHSLFRANEYDTAEKNGVTSLFMGKKNVYSYPDDFADITAFDFRLTKNSQFKNGFATGAFFYLSPNGNDQYDGQSKNTPKKTLKDIPQGGTVYLLPGIYNDNYEINQAELTLSGYGQSAPAVIRGTIKITADRVRLKKLSFVNTDTAVVNSGKDLVIENCGFARVREAVKSVQTAIIRHSAFDSDVENPASGAENVICFSVLNRIPANCILFGNAYSESVPKQDHAGIQLAADFRNPAEGDFTLNNEKSFLGTAADGMMLGPCFFLYEPEKSSYSNLKIYPAGARGASIQFETNKSLKGSFIRYRKKGGQWNTLADDTIDSNLCYVSLNDLEPDTEYECVLSSVRNYCYRLGNHRIPEKTDLENPGHDFSETLVFRTQTADRTPCVWHVSALKGNDLNLGTPEKPFKTIAKASLMTQPGDTVLVHEGTYKETILIPVSGTAEKPITYRGAPGETVWLDGNSRLLCRGFAAFGKAHLRFDAFRVKMFGTALANSSGICLLFGCKDIKISRILYDGRGTGYSPAILHARHSENITMNNCLDISSMNAIVLINSAGITLENNVLKLPFIWPVVVMTDKSHAVRFAYNIVTDNLRNKTNEPLLKLQKPENVDETSNIYFARYPRDLRIVVGTYNEKNWTLDGYYSQMKQNGGSRFADPKFRAMPKLLQWNTLNARAEDLKKDVAFWREVNDYENARDPENNTMFHVWDFSDFFTNPMIKAADGRTIGLEPDKFKDMTDLSKEKEQWQILK